MKLRNIHVATGIINGLEEEPYYFWDKCCWVCDITFTDTSTLLFHQLTFIPVGHTEKEGDINWNHIKKNFKEACIQDGNQVTVMFDDYGQVIAIANNVIGDTWIDVLDKFTVKKFPKLNIGFKSLTVH